MNDQGPVYLKAYTELAQLTLDYLVTVDTPDKAREFVARATDATRNSANVNAKELMKILGRMVEQRAHTELARCKGEINGAKTDGKTASVELTARLHAARATGDQAAEQAVWKEQRIAQASCQAKVDAAKNCANASSLQVDTYRSLASALGIKLADPTVVAPVLQKTQSSSVQSITVHQPCLASLDDLLTEFDRLTGLASVKTAVRQLIDMARVEKMRRAVGLPVAQVSRHLVFTGNPGTGKTTVARLLAQLYTAIGVLRTGQLVEVTRSDLVAGYVGQTAIKTAEAVKRALGGILFIDEAYSLSRNSGSGQDFGQEAIDTLVKLMEDHRDELVVIAAGYGEEMTHFITSNPGLPSRFPRTIVFPDYRTDELVLIFHEMCNSAKYLVSAEVLNALRDHLSALSRTRELGNARLVRNLFECAIAQQASRIIATNSSDLTNLTVDDLEFKLLYHS
jgi:Holliday junction resolvasome RuvABC ATP-dependent DNA helicase subunit